MENEETELGEMSNKSRDTLEEKTFDFKKFCTHMRKSILQNSTFIDIQLENYLTAYEELQNFFILLGTAFQFVAVDVRNKVKILQSYQKEEQSEATSGSSANNYSTVQTMVTYEKNSNLLTNPKFVSGCRTLLRLHRGLDFVRKFLSEIYKLNNDAKLGGIARDVYNQTLADHHSWVVKNAARVAMQFLPTRIELLKKISEYDEEKLNQMLELFPDAIEAMNVVYDTIQHIYTVNELLDLP